MPEMATSGYTDGELAVEVLKDASYEGLDGDDEEGVFGLDLSLPPFLFTKNLYFFPFFSRSLEEILKNGSDSNFRIKYPILRIRSNF